MESTASRDVVLGQELGVLQDLALENQTLGRDWKQTRVLLLNELLQGQH